ncbi:hypothetical protein KIPB_014128, partial [Kipferlia bialata]
TILDTCAGQAREQPGLLSTIRSNSVFRGFPISLLSRGNVAIFGRSARAFSAVSACLKAGIPPSNIVLVEREPSDQWDMDTEVPSSGG